MKRIKARMGVVVDCPIMDTIDLKRCEKCYYSKGTERDPREVETPTVICRHPIVVKLGL